MVADPPAFTSPTSPNRAHRTVLHVDGATWPCHLRVAPSRTSPSSAIKSQDPSFEGPAPRDRLPRRGIIPPGRVGKRRAGFTRRLLALRKAGLSLEKTASLPSLPATEGPQHDRLLNACRFLFVHATPLPLFRPRCPPWTIGLPVSRRWPGLRTRRRQLSPSQAALRRWRCRPNHTSGLRPTCPAGS